ncbi:MAG: hemolysin III family protein [Clostridiales bacterium]|nr:hemolysin III family protein [Clostridiales bacterium]
MKKRTPLSERVLPDYTKGEEICNMVTHIVGGALGILAVVLCAVFGAIHHNAYAVVSGCIYGSSMIVLYAISSVYHGLSPRLTAKKVMQVLDHCSIFILIAGTYTPFCLVTIRQQSPATGWVLFGIVWALAALGMTLNAIDLKKYDRFSMVCYLLMGWCIVFRIGLIYRLLGVTGFVLLLSGGIAYTLGAVLYGFGKNHRYMHSAFHVFTVIGSVLQFLCIILYVM